MGVVGVIEICGSGEPAAVETECGARWQAMGEWKPCAPISVSHRGAMGATGVFGGRGWEEWEEWEEWDL